MAETWTNNSNAYSLQFLGSEKVEKKRRNDIESQKPVSCMTNFLGRSKLSLASRNASHMVKEKKCKTSPFLIRNHAVGAVGYAEVCQPDPKDKNFPISNNKFFEPGNRYRVRFRHSNIYLDRKMNCEVCDNDDAKSCIREAAMKFSDQKRDGPFNLIMFTGRTALASNSVEYNELLRIDSQGKLKAACLENPDLYFALVDGLRKSPDSFASLTYYSQIVYVHETADKTAGKTAADKTAERRLLKFRLVPADYPDTLPVKTRFNLNLQPKESGMLSEKEQRQPWNTKRCADEDKNYLYLIRDFKKKLFHDSNIVKYRLQVQGRPDNDLNNYNPQMIWDESQFPWKDLMIIELTTYLARKEIKKTFFNICDIPPGLSFPVAEFEKEYSSLQKVMISAYTKFERRSISQINDSFLKVVTPAYNDKLTTYDVEVVAQSLKYNEAIPNVDIYIQLLGVEGRTGCHLLDDFDIGPMKMPHRHRHDKCCIECERVGELLAIIVDVEYRNLSEDYFLSNIKITYADLENKTVRKVFPCYQIVTSNIFLPSGEVCLHQKQTSAVMERERKLELSDRRREYAWRPNASSSPLTESLPGRIRSDPERLESLPLQMRSIASKYTGLRFEVDPDIIDFFRKFRSTMMTCKFQDLYAKKFLKGPKGFDQLDGIKMMYANSQGGHQAALMGGGMQGSKMSSNNLMMRNFSKCEIPKAQRIAEVDLVNLRDKVFCDAGDVFDDDNDEIDFTAGRHGSGKDEHDRGDSKTHQDGHDIDSGSDKGSHMEMPVFGLEKLFLEQPKEEKQRGGRFKRAITKNKAKIVKLSRAMDQVIIPEGPVGEMCLRVLRDDNFARMFLVGGNPDMIQQCLRIPEKVKVKRDRLNSVLGKSLDLDEEAAKGNIFIVDYKLLSGVPAVHKEGDNRYMCAPIVLLNQRPTKKEKSTDCDSALIPLL